MPDEVQVTVPVLSTEPATEPQLEEVQTVADNIYEEVQWIKTHLSQLLEKMTNSPQLSPELTAQIDSLRQELRNATERHRETIAKLEALQLLVESHSSAPSTLVPVEQPLEVVTPQSVEADRPAPETVESRRKHRVI